MTTKPCKVCGKLIELPRGGSHKYCDDCRQEVYKEMQRQAAKRYYDRQKKINTCNRCGVEIEKYKSYCAKCRKPRYSSQQQIAQLKQKLITYEQMFASQQQQIEELLQKNKELKKDIKYLKATCFHEEGRRKGRLATRLF
jgi:predicted amidophosphoribosyltransferase